MTKPKVSAKNLLAYLHKQGLTDYNIHRIYNHTSGKIFDSNIEKAVVKLNKLIS